MCKFLSMIVFLSLAVLSLACSSEPAPASDSAEVAETPAAEPTPLDMNDPRALLAEGNRLFDENQTQAAIDMYLRAIELDPDLADAHFQLGIAYELRDRQNLQAGIVTEEPQPSPGGKKKKGDKDEDDRPKTDAEKAYARAIEAYEKWLDKNPKDHAAWFNLGRAHSKLLEDKEAEKAFKEAVELNPDDTEYQTELGSIRIKLAQYHEAIPPLKKAIELDPSNARAVDMLEEAEAGRQRIDYAKKELMENANANAANANRAGAQQGRGSNTNSDTASNTAPPPRAPSNTASPRPTPRLQPTIIRVPTPRTGPRPNIP